MTSTDTQTKETGPAKVQVGRGASVSSRNCDVGLLKCHLAKETVASRWFF
jgi:hypothetical protein